MRIDRRVQEEQIKPKFRKVLEKLLESTVQLFMSALLVSRPKQVPFARVCIQYKSLAIFDADSRLLALDTKLTLPTLE